MKVIILAAGYGTRLLKDLQKANQERFRALIDLPKPLLPIGGLPLICYWIDAFQAIEDTKDIFVITNDIYYNKFKTWMENYPCVTLISDGTTNNEDRLGAVACLQLIIEKCTIDDHVIVIGGDTIFYEDFHLRDVLRKYKTLYQDNNDANLVLSYICKEEETSKYGILETDECQRITAVKEKPPATETASRQACPCFYVFSKHTLPFVKQFLTEKKESPIGEKDAPGHFLSWLVRRKPVYIYPISGRFDVGNLESYITCDEYFQEKIKNIPDYLQ